MRSEPSLELSGKDTRTDKEQRKGIRTNGGYPVWLEGVVVTVFWERGGGSGSLKPT